MGKEKTEHLLSHCLFFTTGKLDRILTRWAEEEFAPFGLAPSAGFALMSLNDRPGMSQNELAGILHLDASTLTRFVDKLELKGLVVRRKEGRMTFLETTAKGQELQEPLAKAWIQIWKRYTELLGVEDGNALARKVNLAALKLEGVEETQ